MRINQFIAQSTGLSRRAADTAVQEQRVRVNGHLARIGELVETDDVVMLDDTPVKFQPIKRMIMLHKPLGYTCSRRSQGSPTIYTLLPPELQDLKSAGRLDKNSSGLILLTNDGDLIFKLTHPKFQKDKIYQIEIDRPLGVRDRERLADPAGISLIDGPSRIEVSPLNPDSKREWQVIMHEGRKRQIRRTFDVLGYTVTRLHRTRMAGYELGALPVGTWQEITPPAEN